eukprot:CAMPEP_0194160032 /NCGR_PEP_ID=MMETSP0152-20130528/78162_1 /TAXON_ID=1049557 /ORGANISM="Thalassiothrix antarctica, Strain L6-D1" /LENGTH=347 /DNA_ID=CAMNT_0038869673 /DNA_START=146 /DNA_END=1189 /DNA_ORIENTATION=-
MIFSQKAIFGLLLIAKSVAIDYQNFEIKADSNYHGDAASKMDYTDISNTDIDDSNADDFDYDNSLSMDSLEESNSELFFEEDFEVEERGKLPKNSIAIDYEDPTDYSNAIDANGKEDVISPDSSEDPYEDFVQIDKEMRSIKGSDINVGYIRGSNFIDTLEEDSFNYSDGVDDGPDNRSGGGRTFTPIKLAVQKYGYSDGWRINMHPRKMADINGDGKADIIGFGNSGVYTSLSLGNGSFTSPKLTVHNYGYYKGDWRTDKHPRMMADVNGDGCADIVGFGNGGVYISLSNGNGTFKSPELQVNNFGYIEGGWRTNLHTRFVIDIDGDRKADVVGFGNPGVYTALRI